MNESQNINDYVSVTTKQDNTNIFYVFKLTKPNLDSMTSAYIKSAFVKYFCEKKNTELGNARNVLDLSKVIDINYEGISTILVANRLSDNNEEGYMSIIGCNTAVKRALQISQIDTVLHIADSLEDLYKISDK